MDYRQDRVAYASYGMPPLLTVYDPIFAQDYAGIVENQSRRRECETVVTSDGTIVKLIVRTRLPGIAGTIGLSCFMWVNSLGEAR